MNTSQIEFDYKKGNIKDISIREINILAKVVKSTSIENLFIKESKVTSDSTDCKKLFVVEESETHKVTSEFEVYSKGYVICTLNIETIKDNDLQSIKLGINLLNKPLFEYNYQIKNMDESDERRYPRAISINFSADERRITNSIDYLLEYVMDGKKIIKKKKNSTFIGWNIENENFSKKGGIYSNRWCIHVSSISNEYNKVRGQRIYHWYGHYPALPPLEMLDEMKEYGCSILILHMPSFKWIDGSTPINEEQFIQVIHKAHSLGIKMMFYMQPLLISQVSPIHNKLEKSLNDNGKLCWNSLKDTQIVFYEPNSDYDCDELCLRCPPAYDYIVKSVIDCYKKYNFDGLYIDFAWPSIAVCTDESHGHIRGLFNFYDYLRMMRELKMLIGEEGLMIGHGGSLLVPSDYAEGFDACLTGEGQKDLLPEVIGVQTGAVPTLWTMHRRKEKQFRSREAMAGIIREGITPHIGLGILGKSIMATMDPAHTPHFIALWQMWRGFPMDKSKFYNYLTENVVTVDNKEITYSMYVTEKNQVLLLVCNGGGPESEKAVSVEVKVQIDIGTLNLPAKMKTMIMKGNTYDTFRITEWDDVYDGSFKISEIGIFEFIGIILYEDELPEETIELVKHLDNRFERMVRINENKLNRLIASDKLVDDYNKLDLKEMNVETFMKNRTME